MTTKLKLAASIVGLSLLTFMVLNILDHRQEHNYIIHMKDGTQIKAYHVRPEGGSLTVQPTAWSNPYYLPADSYLKAERIENNEIVEFFKGDDREVYTKED